MGVLCSSGMEVNILQAEEEIRKLQRGNCSFLIVEVVGVSPPYSYLLMVRKDFPSFYLGWCQPLHVSSRVKVAKRKPLCSKQRQRQALGRGFCQEWVMKVQKDFRGCGEQSFLLSLCNCSSEGEADGTEWVAFMYSCCVAYVEKHNSSFTSPLIGGRYRLQLQLLEYMFLQRRGNVF